MKKVDWEAIWKWCCCASPFPDPIDLEKQEAKRRAIYGFYEYNDEYLTCCGLIHINALCRTIIFAKAFFFGLVLTSSLSMDNIPSLVHFAFFLCYGLAMFSYAILLMGIRSNRFHFVIPYFFVGFILILIAVVHLFIDFLDSANTQDTLSSDRIFSYLMQIGAICFEVYSLMLVYRVFQYICDARMDQEIRERIYMKERLYTDEYLDVT